MKIWGPSIELITEDVYDISQKERAWGRSQLGTRRAAGDLELSLQIVLPRQMLSSCLQPVYAMTHLLSGTLLPLSPPSCTKARLSSNRHSPPLFLLFPPLALRPPVPLAPFSYLLSPCPLLSQVLTTPPPHRFSLGSFPSWLIFSPVPS